MRNTITRLSVLVLAVICLSCKKEYCPAFQGGYDDGVETIVGPSIAILHADDCLMDGQVVSPDRVYDFDLQINSWSGDDAELSRLVVQYNGEVVCDTAINGTELLYKVRVSTYGLSGEAEIVANVVDVFRRRGRWSIKFLVGDSQSLPYIQDFSSSFGTYTTFDVTGPQSWKKAADADVNGRLPWTVNNSVVMTNFVGYTIDSNLDWLVSSPVTLTGVSNAKMVMTYRGFDFADINRAVTLWVRKDLAGANPFLSPWTQLPATLVESYSDFVTVEVSLSQFVGNTIWLAVKFDVEGDNLSNWAGIEIQRIIIEEGEAVTY